MKKILLLTLPILILLFFANQFTAKTQKDEYTKIRKILMDTLVTLTISKNAMQENIQEEIFDELQNYEKIFSPKKNLFQNLKPHEEIFLKDKVFTLFTLAKTYTVKTDGLFDLTIGSISSIWNFSKEHPYIPTEKEIEKAKEYIGIDLYSLDAQKKTLTINKQGVKFDFGGISKGFLVDEIHFILEKKGIHSALIDLGTSTILALGEKKPQHPWQIGLKYPRQDDNSRFCAILNLKDTIISTTGDDEKYFIKDNIRYHHVLDPRTGKPAHSKIVRVSVLIDSNYPHAGIISDILSTSLFIMGKEKAIAFSKTLPQAIATIFITEEKEIYLQNSEKYFSFIDPSFTIIKGEKLSCR